MKLKFILFGVLLVLSCRHDTPKSIGIDQRIKFDVEQMSSLSQDIDTAEYLPWSLMRKGCIPIVQRWFFETERYL